MAETSSFNYCDELRELKVLLWGNDVKQDIFRRWSQGFYFSQYETSALEQSEGGPCAVIAPLQAFIVKNMLLEAEGLNFISNVRKPHNPALYVQQYTLISNEKRYQLLIQGMCEILLQCKSLEYRIVYQNHEKNINSSQSTNSIDNSDESDAVFSEDGSSLIEPPGYLGSLVFHENLGVLTFNNIKDVESYYLDNIKIISDKYGVLLFLYSVLTTKGIEKVKIELSDTSETLIHETYGYGSQGLINLILTGRAVSHVWDNDQDLGGLKLSGIDKQSEVGFITLMEHMRYCTVGSFFKNPKHPVWVLGSETHLTVLFSNERRLVSPETQSEKARRIFKSFDPEGNNFISSILLQDVLMTLDLVSETEYVDIMKKKLDPENLGIILLNAFMDEFFQREESSTPDTFTLMHYNGLTRSNLEGKVKYSVGIAVLLECELKSICESNPMLTCLQTKWPSIEVNWSGGKTPSLN